jgi:hypothetical protein
MKELEPGGGRGMMIASKNKRKIIGRKEGRR